MWGFSGAAVSPLLGKARDRVERAGISNYSFDSDMLILCGVRFRVEPCDCGARDCDGIQLRRSAPAFGKAQRQEQAGGQKRTSSYDSTSGMSLAP
jgi:hypothetical protein